MSFCYRYHGTLWAAGAVHAGIDPWWVDARSEALDLGILLRQLV